MADGRLEAARLMRGGCVGAGKNNHSLLVFIERSRSQHVQIASLHDWDAAAAVFAVGPGFFFFWRPGRTRAAAFRIPTRTESLHVVLCVHASRAQFRRDVAMADL